MAETMTSVEIEDVLSSIRRLVSEDLRPAPRPQVVSKIVVAEKLILTPALRVVSSGFGAEVGPQTAPKKPTASLFKAPAPALFPPPLPRLHLSLDHSVPGATPDIVAALTQAVDQQGLDWESETGDVGPEIDSLDWSSFTFARRSMQETWMAQAAASEVADQLAAHVKDSMADQVSSAAAILAQPESAETASVETASVETASAETASAETVTAVEMPDDAAFTAVSTAKETVADGDAAPQAITDEAPGTWANDAEAEVLAELQVPMAEETVAEPVGDQKIYPQAEAVEAEEVAAVAQEEDNIFSEQVLRELVRDLIREQLQGDLGERITRNIRKLVKAEIARAIAVQALE